jgi:cbb3-type cytochrome oxidase subunit 3
VLQELAARTGAEAWVVASMLFFIGVWVAIAVWVFRARAEDLEAHARLPLDGEDEPRSQPGGNA